MYECLCDPPSVERPFGVRRWAVSAVMTRQNSVPRVHANPGAQNPSGDSATAMSALVPLWDMFNHSDGKLSTDYDVKANTLRCYAMRDFDEGEQVQHLFAGEVVGNSISGVVACRPLFGMHCGA